MSRLWPGVNRKIYPGYSNGGLGGDGGSYIKSLAPIFWIKDLYDHDGTYFIDSSGNNKQISVSTTATLYDSLTMPANDAEIIASLKLAHVYYQFYTDDATPKKVKFSDIDWCSFNTVYFNKTEVTDLVLFSTHLITDVSDKVFTEIGISRSYTLLENKVMDAQGDWSVFKSGTSIVEFVSNALHMKATVVGNGCYFYKQNIYTIGDTLRLTLTNPLITGKIQFVIGGSTPAEVQSTYIIEKTTNDTIIDNLRTIQLSSTRYLGINLNIGTVPNELYLNALKIEKVTFSSVNHIDAFDNNFDNSITYSTDGTTKINSAKSEYSFTTNAIRLRVSALPNIYTAFPTWNELQVLINDTHFGYIKYDSALTHYKILDIPSGNKKVTIINSGVSKPSSTIIGCFLNGLKLKPGSTFTKLTQGAISEKYLFLSDSIGCGGSATHMQEGFANLFKTIDNKEVGILGYGYATLADYAANSTLVNSTVATIVAFFTNAISKKLIITVGTNDDGLNHLASATFISYYSALLDAIYIADSTIEVYCISPLTKGSEGLLPDYRTGILGLCNTKEWPRYVHGPSVVAFNATNYNPDNLHLTTIGHRTAHDYQDDIILT